MKLKMVLALGIAALAAGCGGSASTTTTGGGATPTATPATTATPSSNGTPAASSSPGLTLTTADAQALVNKMVFQNSGYWYECDLSPQTLDQCPLTDKLTQRIPVLENEVSAGGPGGGPVLLRQQLFAAQPQIVSITPSGGAFTVTMVLNIGTAASPTNVKYDLAVVNSGAAWLVDDVSCAGRPQTSAYQQPTAPNWTCD